MREAMEMSEATSDYTAAPLEENLFEWHFTVRGPEDSDFQVGKYFSPEMREKTRSDSANDMFVRDSGESALKIP